MINLKNQLLAWSKAIALAYCHLPIVLLVSFTLDRPSWTWLIVVGLFPWMGMASPCLLIVIMGSLALLPGVWEGQPASWLTPGVSMFIVIGGTIAIFFPLYWYILSRAIDPIHKQVRWRILLIVWTLLGNTFMVLMPPRALTNNDTHSEIVNVNEGCVENRVPSHLVGVKSSLD